MYIYIYVDNRVYIVSLQITYGSLKNGFNMIKLGLLETIFLYKHINGRPFIAFLWWDIWSFVLQSWITTFVESCMGVPLWCWNIFWHWNHEPGFVIMFQKPAWGASLGRFPGHYRNYLVFSRVTMIYPKWIVARRQMHINMNPQCGTPQLLFFWARLSK